MPARWQSSLIALLVLGQLSLVSADEPLSLGARRRILPARTGPRVLKGHDLATARIAANREWFGTPATPAYLDFKARLATAELNRWPASFGMGRTAQSRPGMEAVPANTWASLGPTSNLISASFPDIDSGRPSAVVADPRSDRKILYVATSGGGVFKCSNADHSLPADAWVWTCLTDKLPASSASGNVATGSLALDPANPDTLFLGLGDHVDAEGRGLYKSTDGGLSWVAATGLGNATRIGSILVVNSTTILAGTNDGLKISTNGGASFAPVSGAVASRHIWSLTRVGTTLLASLGGISDGNGNLVTPGQVYRSMDNGATWSQAALPTTVNPDRITLAGSPASGTTAWGIYSDPETDEVAKGLLKTTDGGGTWSFVSAPLVAGGLFQGIGNQMDTDGGQSSYNQGLAVDPLDANRIFVAANLALYRTEDGGQSWTQFSHWYASRHVYTHADFHTTGWSGDGSTLFIGNDGGLAIIRAPRLDSTKIPTSSSGSVASDPTFIDNRRNLGLATHLCYNLGSTIAKTPADSRYRITLGLQDNGTRVRRDASAGGGAPMQTSSVFEDGIGGDGFGTLIHRTDGNKMLGTLYYSRVLRSSNGGGSFSDAFDGIAEADNDKTGVFSTKLAYGDTDDTVYTFSKVNIYKSTDFAGSWTALGTSGLPTDRSIRNVGAALHNPNAIALALNGGRVAVTYSAGATWTSSSDITGGALNTSYIAFNTENDQTLYLTSVSGSATKHHLWKSTNSGASWSPLDGEASASNGFPFGIPVHVIQNMPGQASQLYAGTDFGVYRSLDGGATWARFGEGLPLVATRDLYLAPDGSFIRAATFGRGVWELQLTAPVPTTVINPTAATLITGGTHDFTATATGWTTSNKVTWTAAAGSFASTQTLGDGTTTNRYTAPATVGGPFALAATSVDGGTPATANITVVDPSTVTVNVTPTATSVSTGRTVTLTGAVTGITDTRLTWSASGGNLSATSGATVTWTAPATVGAYTVTATSAAATSRTKVTNLTVTEVVPVSLQLNANAITVLPGGSFGFTVTGDQGGGVTWMATAPTTISAAGQFTAPSTAPLTDLTFTVTATSKLDPTKTATATVTVRSMDLNKDGVVNSRDLLVLAKQWGTAGAASGTEATANLKGSGTVDATDLNALLGLL